MKANEYGKKPSGTAFERADTECKLGNKNGGRVIWS
jgi:hypothetical protein